MRDKFPQAHGFCVEREGEFKNQEVKNQEFKNQEFKNQEAEFIEFPAAAFPAGALSEVLVGGAGGSMMLWLAGVLGAPEQASPHPELVLVDGSDAFDPGSFTVNACASVLWVRCRTAMQMMQAVDLVVRDGNVPLILVDSTGLAQRDLRALPTAAWWRVRQVAERTGSRVVVLAECSLVPCASVRRSLVGDLSVEDFDDSRGALVGRLRWVSQKIRQAT